MSRYLLLLTIFFSSNIWSYPDITIINNNKDYLLVEENALPIIDVNLTINTGSRDDDKIIGLTAFSFALLQEQVLKNEKIINSFEAIGAEYSSSVNKETSEINIRFISSENNIKTVSRLINIMLKHQYITDNSIDDLKEKFVKSINDREKKPGSVLSYRGDEIFFGDSRYRNPIRGYIEDIEKIKLKDVTNKLNSVIKIGKISINLVGNIDQKKASHFIADILFDIPLINNNSDFTYQHGYTNYDRYTHIPHESKQTHISIYIPSIGRTDNNFYNLLVANYIFGGSGFGSMLMREIREKEGLAYSVYSYLQPYENFGILKIGMQTENKNLKKSLDILKQQITNLKNMDFNDKEVELAKVGLLRSFKVRFDTNKKILSTLSAINSYDFQKDYFFDYEEGLKNVTPASIEASLSQILSFDDIMIITVGNDN